MEGRKKVIQSQGVQGDSTVQYVEYGGMKRGWGVGCRVEGGWRVEGG